MADVRQERFEEIYNHITAFSRKYAYRLAEVNMEPEDFTQEVAMQCLTRKGLDNYDEEKTVSFQALIFRICRNKLTDLLRAKFGAKTRQYEGRPYQYLSTEKPIAGQDGEDLTLGDTLFGDEDLTLIYLEMLEGVPDDQISPNYRLSWRRLFELSSNHDHVEIASLVGISASRVRQLQKECARRFC